MTSRTETIVAVLRRPKLQRPVLAHELRGPVVQLLTPGTTVAWQATLPQITEALDAALQRQENERKDTPVGRLPAGTADSARSEILAVLQAAGYNPLAAGELVARAYREPHATPPDEEFRESLAGGHALIIQYGDCELIGSCQCGRRLARITPGKRLDALAVPWERHTCTELPILASSIGAS